MTYRVRAGETLFKIAQRTGLRLEQIRRVNPGMWETVYAGQDIRIPLRPVPPGMARVRKGETLQSFGRRLGVHEGELRRANPKIDKAGSLNMGQLLRLPPRIIAAQRAAEKKIRLARQKAAQKRLAQQRQAQQLAQKKAAAAKAKALAARPPTTYTVRVGDSFYSIAQRLGMRMTTLQAYNPRYANNLPAGAVLRLTPPPAPRMVASPAARTVVKAASTQTTWRWPLAGQTRITSGFGPRNLGNRPEFHDGIDIGAPIGTPVLAARSGRVVTARYDSSGWGRTVVIEHPDGWLTRYAHLNSIGVSVGQLIRTGQPLGTVGNTGRVTGAHLHFGIYQKSTAQNPLALYGQNAD